MKAGLGQDPPLAEANALSSAKRQVVDCRRGPLLLLLLMEKATTTRDPVGPKAMEMHPRKPKKPRYVLRRLCLLLPSRLPLKLPV